MREDRGRSAVFLEFAVALAAAAIMLVLLIVGTARSDWIIAILSLVGLVATSVLAIRGWLSSGGGSAQFDTIWRPAAPDIQKQNLEIEVDELARILQIEGDQKNDLQSAYVVAEDLALRQIQEDENVSVIRHVTVGNTSFEGLFVKNGIVNFIEVVFLVAPDVRGEKVAAMTRKAKQVKTTLDALLPGSKLRLMIVLVTQLTPEDDDVLRNALGRKKFEDTPVDVDIRLLDFESLQRIYVTE